MYLAVAAVVAVAVAVAAAAAVVVMYALNHVPMAKATILDAIQIRLIILPVVVLRPVMLVLNERVK